MAKKCTSCWVDPKVRYPDKNRGTGICPRCAGKTKPYVICGVCEKGHRGLAGRCVVCKGTGQV